MDPITALYSSWSQLLPFRLRDGREQVTVRVFRLSWPDGVTRFDVFADVDKHRVRLTDDLLAEPPGVSLVVSLLTAAAASGRMPAAATT